MSPYCRALRRVGSIVQRGSLRSHERDERNKAEVIAPGTDLAKPSLSPLIHLATSSILVNHQPFMENSYDHQKIQIEKGREACRRQEQTQ